MNILQAMNDEKLFAPFFKDKATWKNWRVVLAALFGLPLTHAQLEVFKQLTGRLTPLKGGFDEAFLIAGRRSGKNAVAAIIATYLACFFDYEKYLAKGELGVVMIVSLNKKQSRIIFRYICALLDGSPMLRNMIVKRDNEFIELSNGICIEITVCNFRSSRGFTTVAVLLDELAFWMNESSANPDSEVIAALRPSMATIPNAKLIGMSSPYRQCGVLYDQYRQHYGNDDSDTLIIKADTRTMNPTVPQKVIDKAYARDEAAARAEYGAEFRTDIAGFLTASWIEDSVRDESTDLPPMHGVKYTGFVDPSGGSRDSFTLAIGHVDNGKYIIDCVRECFPPFLPENVTAEFCALLKAYRIYTCTGDRYAGEWVVQSFKKYGVTYKHSTKSKSVIYLDSLPLFAQGSVELPNNVTLIRQLKNLERRTSRGGQDSIDHPPNAHDDLANAACGVLAHLGKVQNKVRILDLLTGEDISERYNDDFYQNYGI